MTDWGTEFMGEFEQFCIDKQIKIEHSCPYSAWQNGLVERANRTLSRLARTMMLDSQLPTEFWALALSHAAFISNRVCHTHSRQTPFEKVFRKRPDLSNLKVWGCPGVVHVEDKSAAPPEPALDPPPRPPGTTSYPPAFTTFPLAT